MAVEHNEASLCSESQHAGVKSLTGRLAASEGEGSRTVLYLKVKCMSLQ